MKSSVETLDFFYIGGIDGILKGFIEESIDTRHGIEIRELKQEFASRFDVGRIEVGFVQTNEFRDFVTKLGEQKLD